MAGIAARQLGVVHRRQLLDVGLGRGAIAVRLRAGRLHPVLPCVYAVGHPRLPPGGREMAAQLWQAPGGVLSHHSAAWLWGISPPSGTVHVTCVRGGSVSRPEVVLHRARSLDPAELRTRDGFRLTSPARTLLDLAEHASDSDLERAVGEARVRGLTSTDELRAMMARHPGRRGLRPLTALLDVEHGPAFTRSEGEREFLRLVDRAGIPRPRTNARVAGFEVDALWPDQRLVVEVDGYAFHRGRRAFERDRHKSATLATSGFRVLRFTWRQITETPERVAAHVATALAGER